MSRNGKGILTRLACVLCGKGNYYQEITPAMKAAGKKIGKHKKFCNNEKCRKRTEHKETAKLK